MNAMKKWMTAATADEQEALAKSAKTSREYLYQISSGHRIPEPDLAGRIEQAAKPLRKASKNRLPILTRADLSPVCHACPYAKKCLKLTEKSSAKKLPKN